MTSVLSADVVAAAPASVDWAPRRAGRLRVVVLLDRVVHGGAERIALELLRRLDDERFDRILCVTRGLGDPARGPDGWQEALRSDGVGLLGLDRRGPTDLGAWRPLVRLLREADVVHGHMFGSNVWSAVLGSACRVPVTIAHEHSWAFSGQRLRRLVDRHVIARGSDAVIACSPADRRRMIELERLPAERVVLLPNGIDGRAPTPGRDVRAELGISPTAPVIGSVGALRPEKRFDLLLRAAARLREDRPALRLVLVGDGDERPALERLAAELRLDDGALILAGARDDVPDLLEALDVAVTCSDFEGTPLSVLEYMEAGLPVVASAVGGLVDLVEDGVSGRLVPRRDPGALADALGGLLDDPAARLRMGASGRERRRRDYDLDTMVARLAALYEQLHGRAAR